MQPVALLPEEKEVACSLPLHPKDKLKSVGICWRGVGAHPVLPGCVKNPGWR